MFENSENLAFKLENAAILQGDIMDEFDKIENFAKANIYPKETNEVGLVDLARNRYKDVLPYDSNLVTQIKAYW